MEELITDREMIESLIAEHAGQRAVITETESYRPGIPSVHVATVSDSILWGGWDLVDALIIDGIITIRMCDDPYTTSGSVSMRTVTIMEQ